MHITPSKPGKTNLAHASELVFLDADSPNTDRSNLTPGKFWRKGHRLGCLPPINAGSGGEGGTITAGLGDGGRNT